MLCHSSSSSLVFLLLIFLFSVNSAKACFRMSAVPSAKNEEAQPITQIQSEPEPELVQVYTSHETLPAAENLLTPAGLKFMTATDAPDVTEAEHSAHYEADAKIWKPVWSNWTGCLPELGCRQVRHLNWIIVPMDEFNNTEFNEMIKNKTFENPNRQERPCQGYGLSKCFHQLVQASQLFADNTNCGNKPVDQSRRHLVRNRRIIGGTTAKEGTWPWLLQLKISTPSKPLVSCAASVITPRFLITAGHCIANLLPLRSLHTRVLPDTYSAWQEEGRHWQTNSSASLITKNGIKVPVRAFLLHPEYRSFFSGPDIALLDVGWTHYKELWNVEPVCLPDSFRNIPRLNMNACYAAGWGYAAPKPNKRTAPSNAKPSNEDDQEQDLWALPYESAGYDEFKLPTLAHYMYGDLRPPTTAQPYFPKRPQPREVRMPISPLSACKESYHTQWLREDRHVCVGGTGYGTCTGDSGGGFYCPDQATNRWQLVGVVSFHHTKGCGSHESVMANVSSQHLWMTTSIIGRMESTSNFGN